MDSFVVDKLTEWRLSELIENFRDEHFTLCTLTSSLYT